MHDSDKEYEVGYGKPPKATQFKKGQSGNPKGRKPKSYWRKNTDEKDQQIMDAMLTEVTLLENGVPVKMEAIDAIYKKLIERAIKGDFKTAKFLMEQFHAAVERHESKRLSFAETLFQVEKNIEAEAERRAKEREARRHH